MPFDVNTHLKTLGMLDTIYNKSCEELRNFPAWAIGVSEPQPLPATLLFIREYYKAGQADEPLLMFDWEGTNVSHREHLRDETRVKT